MERLTPATSQFLLNAGIEDLHQQSNEWLSELAFWRDEVAFLYALIVKKTLTVLPIADKDKLDLIEAELVRITGGELDDLYDEVSMHAYYLSQMIESKKEDQESYREKHFILNKKFIAFTKKFKAIKLSIFQLVKSL